MTENDKIIKLIEEFLLTYKKVFIPELVYDDFNEFERILNSEKDNFDKEYVLIDKEKIINKKDKEDYYDSFMEEMKKSKESIKEKFIKYLLEIFFEIFYEAPNNYNDRKLYNNLVEIKENYSQVGGKTRKSRKQVRKSRKSKKPRKQVRKSRKSRKQVRKSRKSRKQVRRNRK